jgi:hypothetical protein
MLPLLYPQSPESLKEFVDEAKKPVKHRLYIPSGFDLLAALPVKEKKHVDKYAFLTTYLYRSAFLNHKYDKASFIPVSSKLFEKYVTRRRASSVIDFWVTAGVIEQNTKFSYQVGQQSKSYRFTKEYRKVKAIEMMVVDEVFEKRLTTLKVTNVMNVDATVPQLAYLLRNLKDVRIDHTLAYEWLLKSVDAGTGVNYEKYHHTIDALIKQEWFFVRDGKGRRVHNNFVTLPKALKPYIYLQHEVLANLVNIDVANSQPLILAMMMKRDAAVNDKADFTTFLSLCESGKLYSELMTRLSLETLSKREFKDKLFTWFYGKNQHVIYTPEWIAFSAAFPTVAAYIVEAKRVNYKALSHAMQREESALMVDTVIQRVAADYPASWCLTVHDSVTTTRA